MTLAYANHPGERKHRGLSDDLWRDMPLEYMQCNPRKGLFYLEDFRLFVDDLHGWVSSVLNASSGTVTQQGWPGKVRLDAAATTADHGVQYVGASHAIWLPAAGRTLCYEALVNVVAFDADGAMVIGLGTSAAAVITATQTLHADVVSFLGFVMEAADTSWQEWGEKAGVANTATGVGTIATGWTKLGFRVEGTSKCEFYVDGVQMPSASNLTSTNIPVATAMVPIFATCNESGTGTQHKLDVDWVAIGCKDEADVLS